MAYKVVLKYHQRTMLWFFYNFAFVLIVILASPYLLWLCVSSRRHRMGILNKLGLVGLKSLKNKFKPEDRPIWIHSVSVGEVLASLPLIDELKKKHPVCLSTTTATGYQVAVSKCSPSVAVFYYPFDISFIVKKFLKTLHPRMIILMESEFWPGLILRAHKNKIPVLVLNGRISPSSQKLYRYFKLFYHHLFKRVKFFGVQSHELKQFLMNLGVEGEKIQVTGNIKFDLAIPEGFRGGEFSFPIFTAASTHIGEEKTILNIYKRLKEKFKTLKLVLIPRHHERLREVKKIVVDILGREPAIRDKFPSPVFKWLSQNHDVFLVGTFGELLEFYSASTLVFVGKSLFPPGGGQNIIEPCALGRVVVCGPYMGNFREVTEYFLEERAIVQTYSRELEKHIFHLLGDEKARKDLEGHARRAVDKKRGIVSKNVKIVESIIEEQKRH